MSDITITTDPLLPSDPRFSVTHRQELITGFNQARLSAATCVMIGAGGIGSEIGEGLCRKGIGRLVIIDHDVVDSTNLNRQHFFAEDIGLNKARCLAQNLARHCISGTTLEGHAVSFEDAIALGRSLPADVVVCGVDNGHTRVAVSRRYRNRRVPVIFVAVDLLAEAGHTFVQEGYTCSACFGCAFPKTLYGTTAPCFVPASKDILKSVAGFALYAIDSVLMERNRAWNFRRLHLAGYAPDVNAVLEQRPDCPLCSGNQQQGSSDIHT